MKVKNIFTRVPSNFGLFTERYLELWDEQVEKLKEKFQSAILEVQNPKDFPVDCLVVFIDKNKIIEVLKFLKEEPGFEYSFLSDLTASDESLGEPLYHIIYNLYSHNKRSRVRIKVKLKNEETVPTSVSLWKGANWAEREVYDMFGVKFLGHPDLRRILLDSRWEGYPLRKEYPIKKYQIFPNPEPPYPDLLKD